MNTDITELTAAQEQLSKALGLDHGKVAAQSFIAWLANSEATSPWEHTWIARLREILPRQAEAVEALYPCPSQDGDGDPEEAYPCTVCVATDHEWELDDQFNQAEADCQAIAEKLAELLADVPGPIEEVDVIPSCHDSNLAEVKVQRTSQGEGQ
jgi:hypothetical protein